MIMTLTWVGKCLNLSMQHTEEFRKSPEINPPTLLGIGKAE